MTTAEKYAKYVMLNYGKRNITLARGKGCNVWDENGKKYLDFAGGIAVLSLGHANPAWVKAVSKQASVLAHCSNLYMFKGQADLAEALVKEIGVGKMFFCNSGAEANEALFKAARLHGYKASGAPGKKFRIVSAVNGFHGRTLATLSATAQEKIQKGFAPLMPVFDYAVYNDLESFKKVVKPDVAAVIVEPIQGESGVTPATKEFLKGLKELCQKNNAMLLFDEVQCGVGRTGAFLACQKLGVMPDGVSLAKGLGGGFPIGAIWLSKKYADLFEPGSHGSTFGGNPLACSAALAVLKEMSSKKLPQNAAKMGKLLSAGLSKIAKKYPEKLLFARGSGLMQAAIFAEGVLNTNVSARAIENGLILAPAGSNALRFLPPLNITKADVANALKLFEKTVKEI